MLHASELTTGEKLLVLRRRAGLTAAKAAKKRKLSLYRYNRLERDEEDGPRVAVGKLAFHERAFLCRRRAGLTVDQLAKRFGVSGWWLSQMEAGKVPDARLRAGWAGQPPPNRSKGRQARSPRASARIRRRAS